MTTPQPDVPALVLAAMPEEAAPLLDRLADVRPVLCPLQGVVAQQGALPSGRNVAVVTTGIGIAAAAAATTWGVLALSPSLVLSIGSTGGLAADIEVGTLVVATEAAYSIADATAFGYAPGQVPGSPARFHPDEGLARQAEQAARSVDGAAGVRTGLMLSGDAFVTAELADPMRERFPEALTADMESTAIIRTAAALGVPVAVLRAVSDLCGPAAGQQFHLELNVVAELSARGAVALVESVGPGEAGGDGETRADREADAASHT